MGRLKILALFVLIFAAALVQPGCWDYNEVEKLSIVFATALDQAPDGRVRVTTQSISPRFLVGGAGGGGGGGGATGVGRGFRNISAEGNTVMDCIRILSLEAPRRLYFAHNQLILISEELARHRGIEELMDFFYRNPRIRGTNWILVARSDISSILETPGELVVPPSHFIVGTIEEQKMSSYYPDIQLGDFLELFETEGVDAFTGLVELKPNEAETRSKTAKNSTGDDGGKKPIGSVVKLGGTAVFSGNKLAGLLDERESRGLLWVRGKVKGGAITVPCGKGGEDTLLALEILRNSSKIEPDFTDGELSITVKIKVKANIHETECQEELDRPEVLSSVGHLLADAVRGEVEAALVKAQQEYRSDVFGFGEAVHRKYPGVWKEIKDNWGEEIYPFLPVYIDVKGEIARVGMIFKPFKVKR